MDERRSDPRTLEPLSRLNHEASRSSSRTRLPGASNPARLPTTRRSFLRRREPVDRKRRTEGARLCDLATATRWDHPVYSPRSARTRRSSPGTAGGTRATLVLNQRDARSRDVMRNTAGCAPAGQEEVAARIASPPRPGEMSAQIQLRCPGPLRQRQRVLTGSRARHDDYGNSVRARRPRPVIHYRSSTRLLSRRIGPATASGAEVRKSWRGSRPARNPHRRKAASPQSPTRLTKRRRVSWPGDSTLLFSTCRLGNARVPDRVVRARTGRRARLRTSSTAVSPRRKRASETGPSSRGTRSRVRHDQGRSRLLRRGLRPHPWHQGLPTSPPRSPTAGAGAGRARWSRFPSDIGGAMGGRSPSGGSV